MLDTIRYEQAKKIVYNRERPKGLYLCQKPDSMWWAIDTTGEDMFWEEKRRREQAAFDRYDDFEYSGRISWLEETGRDVEPELFEHEEMPRFPPRVATATFIFRDDAEVWLLNDFIEARNPRYPELRLDLQRYGMRYFQNRLSPKELLCYMNLYGVTRRYVDFIETLGDPPFGIPPGFDFDQPALYIWKEYKDVIIHNMESIFGKKYHQLPPYYLR